MPLSFKDYLDDYIADQPMENDDDGNGTYASVNMSYACTVKLEDWLEEHKEHIPKPLDSVMNPFHATIMFSRGVLPTLKDEKVSLPFSARPLEWRIFDQGNRGGKALVMLLKSEYLEQLHRKFMKLPNATYDYAEFLPHVTVSTDYTLDKVPDVKPNFNFVFDYFLVEPLHLN